MSFCFEDVYSPRIPIRARDSNVLIIIGLNLQGYLLDFDYITRAPPE